MPRVTVEGRRGAWMSSPHTPLPPSTLHGGVEVWTVGRGDPQPSTPPRSPVTPIGVATP